MKFQLLAGVCAALALSACAPPKIGAEAVVAKVYAPYVSHEAERGGPSFDALPVYSKSFKTEIDRGLTYGHLLNEPVIDFDPIANGQDFSVTHLKLLTSQTGAKAQVVASFDNLGAPTQVTYDLVVEGGAWKIDEIKPGEEDLRKIIADALKPIGDPAAMKAPVAALYALDATAPPTGALAASTGLAPDLKALLEKAAAKAPGGPLGFDPVRGGPGATIADVSLEAASGAVIARFKVDGRECVVVYDVVEQDGGWRIDDIRGPNDEPPWDLRLKLEDLGIK